MEKLPGDKAMNRSTMKTGHFCIPRRVSIIRGSNNNTSSCTPGRSRRRLSPMSLLERFREAVLRLIMLTALSKATAGSGGQSTVSSNDLPLPRTYYYPSPHDPHQSEAVAECIEFIKKKSASIMDETDEDNLEEDSIEEDSMAGSCFVVDEHVQVMSLRDTMVDY